MDIEKKIRKLLALSESPNEFEAQAALLKARQLMAEYKLTEAELHEGNKKVKTIKTSISCTKQTNFWIFNLSTVIGENYCCQAVHERAKHSKTYFIGFVGLEEDVSICVNIFIYAVDCVLTQIQNLKQTYCNLSLGAQKKITNGYGAGFCEGVREAFSKQDQEKEKEWSLILRLPKEVIDFCDKFNTGQGNMYDTPIDFRKFSSGYLDGKCFGEQKRLQPARHASTI